MTATGRGTSEANEMACISVGKPQKVCSAMFSCPEVLEGRGGRGGGGGRGVGWERLGTRNILDL